ncbi:TonB family protein [Sinobacterium caligoides]|uniref:TonB family protein n=1 Tax=Sinobacterium caligoides TaxID=933926 RepID=A0A3N2DZQ8_9GAMM|nr:TonB family protein [Sinobacterium caligoides]ROS04795.1 TonB family protein [Sinobacterium caligoides]
MRIITIVFFSQLMSFMAVAETLPEGMVLNGVAEFKELNRSYFVGALYLEEPANTAEAVQALASTRRMMEIRVTAKRWSPRRFSSQWTQLIVANNEEAMLNRYSDEFIAFNNMARFSLKRGDTLLFDQSPDGKIVIHVNGVKTASYDRIGSFDMLLNTWIGKRPPSTEFKQSILGAVDNAGALSLYEATTVQPERRDIVVQWMGAMQQLAMAAGSGEVPAASLGGLANATTEAVDAASTLEIVPDKIESTKPASQSIVVEEKEVVAELVEESVAVEEELVDDLELGDDFDIDPEIIQQQHDMMLKLYRSSIVKQTLRKVQYPSRAIKRGLEGLVVVEVRLDRFGKRLSAERVQSAKYSLLNKAAMAAVSSVESYPAAPIALKGDVISVKVPIRFALN